MASIRVDPDELNMVADQLNTSIYDMNQAVHQAYRQLSSIRDSAKGLDDIRSRAANLYRMHTNLMQDGNIVQQHIAQSAIRFGEIDRQCASMLANSVTAHQSVWQQMLNHTIDGTTRIDDVLRNMQYMAGAIVGTSQLTSVRLFVQYGPAFVHLNRMGLFKVFTMLGRKFNLLASVLNMKIGYVGKMQGIYRSVKGMIPHGNLMPMAHLKLLGKVAVFTDSVISSAKSVYELSNSFRTGDFRPAWKQAKETAATFIVDKLVYSALALAATGATLATATVGGKIVLVAGAAIVTSELIQGGGYLLATGLEFFGKNHEAKWIKDSLPHIDLKKGIINTITDSIDGIEDVVVNPKSSLQKHVDFISAKRNQSNPYAIKFESSEGMGAGGIQGW